jgi:hypothetical protein
MEALICVLIPEVVLAASQSELMALHLRPLLMVGVHAKDLSCILVLDGNQHLDSVVLNTDAYPLNLSLSLSLALTVLRSQSTLSISTNQRLTSFLLLSSQSQP